MAENKVDVGGWINEAFELYKTNFGLLCLATLVAGLLGAFTCGVLAGPMFAGVIMIILRVSRQTEPKPQIGDVFKGFDFFLQALLLVVVLAVAYGVLSFLPVIGGVAGLLIAPLVMFAMPLIVDQKQEFWPAIQASYEKAKEDYVSLLVITLLGSLISSLGLLLCGVGVILTAPFGAILSVVAYRHLFEGVTAEPVPVADVPVMDVPPAEPTQA
ncbi:MAG: hypothetical protein PHO14_10700 [Kiritimatiellae bacterium]|nr:hypothetical protein [Kiritimatiellia bacterium]MDD4342682.1 hypothetical protein [Kiritimatiellia bacterium]